MQRVLALLLLVILSVPSLAQQNRQEQREPTAPNPQVSIDGLFPLKWDARAGKMTMQITRFNRDVTGTTALFHHVREKAVRFARSLARHQEIAVFEVHRVDRIERNEATQIDLLR